MSPDRASTSPLLYRTDGSPTRPVRPGSPSAATSAAADSARCSRSTVGPSRSSPRTSAAWSAAIRSTLQSGSSWVRKSCISPFSAACAASIRGLSAALTIAPCKFACASLIGPHARCSQASCRVDSASWTAVGQPPAVAFERQPRRLDLERGAQLVELDDVLGAQARHARAAVGLDPHEPFRGELAQRRAQRVARDAVARGQLLLDQPLAAGPLAVEDLPAQRVGDGLDRGHAGTVAGRRISGAASTSRPARISAPPTAAGALRCSLRTITPSSVAVSGSASVSVAVSAALTGA